LVFESKPPRAFLVAAVVLGAFLTLGLGWLAWLSPGADGRTLATATEPARTSPEPLAAATADAQPSPTPSPPRADPTEQSSAAFNTYYVSRDGGGGDGRSWQSAWQELDRIDWGVIRPGDTILFDGGSAEMVYETTLTVKRSGTRERPITLRLADEPGRDGKAIVFGGRHEPLPYCEQREYDREDARSVGIDLGGQAWVILEGMKWGGIAVHGHDMHGITLNGDAHDIVVRNVEVYDNGTAKRNNGRWYPGQDGVRLAGTRIVFERVLVHDNGEDAFQSDGDLADFTLRDSWLYNTRKDAEGRVWNYCQHPDGLQVWDGGEQSGVTIEGSVVGPGFMHGLLLGDKDAVVHDLTVRNSLFYGNRNANILSNPNQPEPSEGWLLENVTSDRAAGDKWTNVGFQWEDGYGDPDELTIRDSIFTGGYNMEVPAKGDYAGNFFWEVGGTAVGRKADPRYADGNAYGSTAPNADYRLDDDSPAAGLGTTVTSSSILLGKP
jgi:hypothetical protein